MGGKNHQPCNKPNTNYLRFSTLMSRELSSACSLLEQANVVLEDVLLSELNGSGTGGTVMPVSALLSESQSKLLEMLNAIGMLQVDMQEHSFEDLPTLQSTDLDLLGEQLVSAGIVQGTAWSTVSGAMRRGGFYEVLRDFELTIGKLQMLTGSLIVALISAEHMARAGELNTVLEQNQPANFKVEFAKLYTAWLDFQQIFLASSMLSTELWYRHCDVGSLLEPRNEVQVA